MLTDRFVTATQLALQWHASQVRKGTAIPYASHLLGVASLVLEHGGNEDQAIAGLLHDAIEDVGPHVAPLIAEHFGTEVLRIVEACTDGVPDAQGIKPDWHQRKNAYLAHLEQTDHAILLVSCCDKLYNARATLSDLYDIGADVFNRFTGGKDGTLWYYRRLSGIFSARLDNRLSAEFARTVDAILQA